MKIGTADWIGAAMAISRALDSSRRADVLIGDGAGKERATVDHVEAWTGGRPRLWGAGSDEFSMWETSTLS
jgi:hypothetical protein